MHRPIASLLTVVWLSCVATASAEPAPIFTSEDVLAVRTFAGGQGVALSPTGRWVAYALTDANDEWNVQEPRPTSHVVVADARRRSSRGAARADDRRVPQLVPGLVARRSSAGVHPRAAV